MSDLNGVSFVKPELLEVQMIMATTPKGVVGKGSGLPWDSKTDMAWFVKNTKGKAILLGRTTLEGIGKVLPNRLNLVLSRDPDYRFEGAITVTSVEEAFQYALKNKIYELVVCGGPQVYDLAFPFVDRLYLTVFHDEYEGDVVYLPNIAFVKPYDPTPVSDRPLFMFRDNMVKKDEEAAYFDCMRILKHTPRNPQVFMDALNKPFK